MGKNKGDLTVDIENQESIKEMYRQTGKIDAVISTAGAVHFGLLKVALSYSKSVEGLQTGRTYSVGKI